jgi:hypothetical protein
MVNPGVYISELQIVWQLDKVSYTVSGLQQCILKEKPRTGPMITEKTVFL